MELNKTTSSKIHSSAHKDKGAFFSFAQEGKSNTPFFQPKLTINQPNDPLEQEADAMAENVMGLGQQEIAMKSQPTEAIQKIPNQLAGEKNPEEELQLKSDDKRGATVDTDLENYVGGLSSGGNSLPKEVLNFYEPKFGANFSNVKIHTGSKAEESAQSVNALAYTTGSNIVFNTGQYNPNCNTGKKLLAHELTHVVQQTKGLATKKIQRALPAIVAGLGAAEWIAVGATGYVVGSDAINSSSGDITYTFDEMEGVVLPGGGTDVSAYRQLHPNSTINEASHHLAVWFGTSGTRKMGIKFGINFLYDGNAMGNISLNIIETYDWPGWAGSVNVNITPRSLSAGISSVRFTINMGTSNSWFNPDRTGSELFILRADGDLTRTSTTGAWHEIG